MRDRLLALALLWFVGNALRYAILAVPPVIPALRAQFGFSGTEIGVLTGLPIVLFAAAALAGSRRSRGSASCQSRRRGGYCR